MLNSEKLNLTDTVWREKVYIETPEHIICGYIYMQKMGKRNRLISDILSAGRSFIAVKDCTLEYKNAPNRNMESHPFVQVNLASVIIMRLADEG